MAETDYYKIELDTETGGITTAPCTITEYVQGEVEKIPEAQRRQAAAEFYARILTNTPPAYRDPWLTNSLREGIETTLGLRALPPEEGEK